MLPHAPSVLSHAPSMLARALSVLPRAPSMLARALSVLPRAPSMLARAPPQPLPSFVLAVDILQVQARPLVQLEVDADPVALYMTLPAAHIRPSPLSFSFIPVAVYILS